MLHHQSQRSACAHCQATAVEPFAEFYVTSTGSHTNGGYPTGIIVSTGATNEDGDLIALTSGKIWAHGGSLTYDATEGTMTTAGNNKGCMQYLNKGESGITLKSMSYSFDASWTQNGTDPSYFTAIGEDASGTNVYSHRIGIADGKWTITTAGYDALTLTTQMAVGATTGSGSYLVTSELVDKTYTLSLYENGNLLVSGTLQNANFGAPGQFKLSFGGCHGTKDNSMAATFSNIKLYNSVVPEPTTATLSLLALAGLAARRRRR